MRMRELDPASGAPCPKRSPHAEDEGEGGVSGATSPRHRALQYACGYRKFGKSIPDISVEMDEIRLE